MLAVVTVLLTVTGCAPRIRHVPQEVLVSGVDLRAHTREGFLFSPNAYTGQFEAVGLVTVSVYAEARVPAQSKNAVRGMGRSTCPARQRSGGGAPFCRSDGGERAGESLAARGQQAGG